MTYCSMKTQVVTQSILHDHIFVKKTRNYMVFKIDWLIDTIIETKEFKASCKHCVYWRNTAGGREYALPFFKYTYFYFVLLLKKRWIITLVTWIFNKINVNKNRHCDRYLYWAITMKPVILYAVMVFHFKWIGTVV